MGGVPAREDRLPDRQLWGGIAAAGKGLIDRAQGLAGRGKAAPATDVLAGGGDMGARMRAFDWSTTPLGPPETWQPALKTAVRILLSSRFAMWMAWGPELTFLCNDAYLPTTGMKRDWVLGARSDRVWAEIWPDIGPRIDHVLSTGEATWDEALRLYLARSGFPEETYHTFSYSPLADDAGNTAGMLCVVAEVTERVFGERQLATLRDLGLRLAGASSRDDVMAAVEACFAAASHDLPFALTYLVEPNGAHAGLAAIHGVRRDSPAAAGRLALSAALQVWGFDPGSDASSFAAVAPEHLEGLALAHWQVMPQQALVVPIKGGEGTAAVGFFVAGLNPHRRVDESYRGFIELLTGQIAAAIARADEYERERARAESLAELDRAKTAFFANVSHEFRTPLTLMLGPLEDALGAAGDLPAQQAERVEIAHRNGLRLLKLVNGLLDVSRIEAGRVEASYEPTDLSAYTAELVSTFRSACERAGLNLEVDAPPLPTPVHVDREMWEKIVLNLMSNAFKFTLEGAITVTVRSVDGMARLTVRDTGGGIPSDELPKLFERFHRVEGARGRSFEGSGIGLALVRELVQLHGGTITVESEEGRGSAFHVTVPLGAAHLPADRLRAPGAETNPLRRRAAVEEALRWLPDEDAPTSSAGSDATAPEPGRGARIVLADDNADMRGYIRRLLEGEGYAVTAVPDGADALAAVRRERPDLVLTDVMMPNLDGFGLLAEIRGDPNLSDLSVIMLSARAGDEAQVEGFDAGADDYVIKPFSARELLARVSANLLLSKARRGLARRQRFTFLLEENLRKASSPAEALQLACALIGRELGAAVAGIAELQPDGRHVLVETEWKMPGAASVTGLHLFDDFGPARRGFLSAGKTVAIGDVKADPRVAGTQAEASYAANGVRASLEIPLMRDGALRAFLFAADSDARTWSDEQVALASETVERAWQTVERVRAENALILSEARAQAQREELQAILDTAPAAIWVAEDPDCKSIRGNRYAAELLRRPQSSNHSFSALDGPPPQVRPTSRGMPLDPQDLPLQRVCRGEEVGESDLTYTFDDGKEITMVGAARRLLDKDGRVRGAVYVGVDVSQQRAEAKAKAYRAALADELRAGPSEAVRAASRLLREYFGAIRAGYAELDDSGDDLVIALPADGEAKPAPFRISAYGERLPDALRAGETLVVEDVLTDPRTAARAELYGKFGIRSFVGVPYLREGQPRALLYLHHAKPRAWTQEELALIEETAARTWGVIEQARAEDGLRQRTEELESLLVSAPLGIAFFDPEHRYVRINAELAAINGGTVEGHIGRTVEDIVPDLAADVKPLLDRVLATGETVRDVEIAGRTQRDPDRPRHWLTSYYPVHRDGQVVAVGAWVIDITARKDMESRLKDLNDTLETKVAESLTEREAALAQLHEAQKIESIGQLTGGVAHDFNNLLAAVLSNLDLVRKRVDDPRAIHLLDGAIKGAERGASLTARLLAFARRQDLKAIAVSVPALFGGMRDLLARSIGPGVTIESAFEPGLPAVTVDPNQLELALLNLAVNARDAMPDGGTLKVGASAETVSVISAADGLKPGEYVRIRVSDTGTGMDEETLRRATEPFYTTKGVGKGTGLGLSMVHGLAIQSGGVLRLESRAGSGSTVELWLPRADSQPQAAPAPPAAPTEPAPQADAGQRRLTLLVVDDDALVAMGTVASLEDLGHDVIEAHSGQEALAKLQQHPEIDIVMTDHAMPGMTGLELIQRLAVSHPGLPIILATGYAELPRGADPNIPRLGKPFRQEEIIAAIDGLMQGRVPRRSG